jgi:lysophospholipase L1-like esterase
VFAPRRSVTLRQRRGSPTDESTTLRDVPRGRRGRTAATLLCAAPAVVLAYVAVDAVHPADSARTGHPSVVASRHELLQDRPSLSAVRARTRATTYGIAFFGDSVSVGFGASDREHGYVARVSRWLRGRRTRVVATINAKGGVRVAYWEYGSMPTKLDAAVVELGTNDVRFGTPPAQFVREYRTLTGRIRARHPKAQILCVSVWPRQGGTHLEGVINARIRAVCPGTYVDITRLRDRSHIRSSDGFHPNDLGYRLIARAVESKLKTG